VEPDLVERMCAAQEHRGPDSRGLHLEPGVGLGIQRLRVIDLVTGDQPIHNEDGSVTVVLNGEIYNYRELRRGLLERGHSFTTDGDTEVIVHLYEELGSACVGELHGMFCFALWDGRRGELLLARDRVGKKPLFYSHREGALSFASELGALLQDPGVSRELDHHALDAYLAYGYVPAPLSAFAQVRKLPPAHTLQYRDGKIRTERYWELDYAAKRTDASAAELEEQVRDGIRRAVRRRMVADVPIGVFLSGGVDSSAVAGAMAECSAVPIKTFSIGFEESSVNELPLARLVARELSSEHHELLVRPDAVELLPQLVRHYGEPFADHAALPSFYLARFARRHVTVALTGDGGDESFAGYQRYTTNLLLGRLDAVPRPLRGAAAWLAGSVPGVHARKGPAGRLARLARAAPLDRQSRYLGQRSIFGEDVRADMYTREYLALLGPSRAADFVLEPWRGSGATSLLDRMLDVDVGGYLPDDLLTKIDIATMAYSLEARSPLLDHELMELAASLPAELKATGGSRKRILRAAVRGWVPDEVLNAPKQGFEVPVAQWFRGELHDYVHEVLLDRASVSRGWCRPEWVQGLLSDHCSGRADHGRGIWALLMLELWYREMASPATVQPCAPAGAAA
jgi:asparagine synthase (glutamine-hydrolysing)